MGVRSASGASRIVTTTCQAGTDQLAGGSANPNFFSRLLTF